LTDRLRDPAAIEAAIADGRMFVAFELLGTPVGFDVVATGPAGTVEQGGELPASGGALLTVAVPTVFELAATLPTPNIRARVIRIDAGGAAEVAAGPGPTLTVGARSSGAYRVEILMTPRHLGPYLGSLGPAYAERELPWIYATRSTSCRDVGRGGAPPRRCYAFVVRRLALVACLGLGGCPPPLPSTCRVDDDCGGEVCTRVGVCTDAPTSLRVSWTIAGQPASATACAGISELELSIIDPSTGTAHTVRPVPCAPGSFFYDKLPPELHRRAAVVVRAVGATRRLRHRQLDRQRRRAHARPRALTSATR
jgi:hypothetical protein